MTEPRVLIGVFSINEGKNLETLVHQILEDAPGPEVSVILLDESTEEDSIGIVRRLAGVPRVRRMDRPRPGRGKVPALNALYVEFLAGPAEILLHFDADQTIRPGCVRRMIEAVRSGTDLAAAVSYALPGRTWFERGMRLALRPGELERARSGGGDPLLGHNGAYSRRAVEQLSPVPEQGVNEELFLLCLSETRGLRRAIVAGAGADFRLPANARDYVRGAQRVQNRAASFLRWCSRQDDSGVLTERARRMLERIDRLPTPGAALEALREDPAAALAIPELFALRWVVRLRRRPSESDLWEPVTSSKGLAG